MDVIEIWEDYCEKQASLNLLRDVSKRSTGSEIYDLEEELDYQDDALNRGGSTYFMAEPISGSLTRYGGGAINTSELIQVLEDREIKNDQWVLYESYENFRLFCERVYAYLGQKDPGSWLLGDYGRKMKFSDIGSLGFDGFLAHAQKISNHELITRIDGLNPGLVKRSQDNESDIDLDAHLKLIRELRHCIVHHGGAISSKTELLSKVSEKIKNKASVEELSKTIDLVVIRREGRLVIHLGHVDIKSDIIGIGFYSDLLLELIKCLVSYAYLIGSYVDDRFYDQTAELRVFSKPPN